MWESLLNYKIYFFVAFVVLIPLLGYAIYLQLKTLNLLKTTNEQQRKETIENSLKRQEGLRESIHIISLATLQKQCETSEACLRLAHLLPIWDQVNHLDKEWEVIFNLFDEIKDLKILEARKELRMRDRHQEDMKRYQSEEKYHNEVMAACEKLVQLTTTKQ